MEKVSVSLMSLPLGCFVRGRSLAQARDCRVRLTSGSAGLHVSSEYGEQRDSTYAGQSRLLYDHKLDDLPLPNH